MNMKSRLKLYDSPLASKRRWWDEQCKNRPNHKIIYPYARCEAEDIDSALNPDNNKGCDEFVECGMGRVLLNANPNTPAYYVCEHCHKIITSKPMLYGARVKIFSGSQEPFFGDMKIRR